MRDAQGNVMATYTKTAAVTNDALNYTAIADWIIAHDSWGEDSLISLISWYYHNDLAFKQLLATKMVENNLTDSIIKDLDYTDFLGWDANLSLSLMQEYWNGGSTDFNWLLLALLDEPSLKTDVVNGFMGLLPPDQLISRILDADADQFLM